VQMQIFFILQGARVLSTSKRDGTKYQVSYKASDDVHRHSKYFWWNSRG